MTEASSRGRIEIVDLLRGIAALSVAWFHFTHGNAGFLPEGWLKASGRHGWLGVEVFFAISGFMIPWSLFKGGYRPREHLGRFLFKRTLRIEPPYLVSIAIVIALWCLSSLMPGFRGEAPRIAVGDVLLHIGYLNAFFDRPWLNVVYWTLALEFQFYLLIAVVYPWLASRQIFVRVTSVAAMTLAGALVPDARWVAHWLPLFALGVVAFQRLANLSSPPEFWLVICLAAAGCAWVMSPIVAGLGLITALLITSVRRSFPTPLLWLGLVSYPLYLLHVPIGGRVVNLGARFADTAPSHGLVLLAATAASLLAAWGMHVWIERPCQQLSARLRYERASSTPALARAEIACEAP